MRIIKEDQNTLIIKDRSLGTLFTGIIFALIGIFIFVRPDSINTLPQLWAVVFVVVGLFILAFTKTILITLDKIGKKITISWKKLAGSGSKEYTFELIKQLEFQIVGSSNKNVPTYQLFFVLQSGEVVPLAGRSTTISTMGQWIIADKSVGEKAANFLGVPLEVRGPLTMSETISVMTSAFQSVAQGLKQKEPEK